MAKTIFNAKKSSRCLFSILISFFVSIQADASLPDVNKTASAQVGKVQHKQEIIVLIHGLMRSTGSMNALRFYLERQGYPVYSYSYLSHRYTIHQHGTDLSHFIQELLVKNPGIKVSFITHSLGGIIARDALAQLSPQQLKRISSLIMLAPPNQGSEFAKISTYFPIVGHVVKPLGELSSDKAAYVHHVPVPKVKIGIIAGKFDGKVRPSSARLDGQAEPMVVNSTHTFIMNNPQTRRLILSFLDHGTFKQD